MFLKLRLNELTDGEMVKYLTSGAEYRREKTDEEQPLQELQSSVVPDRLVEYAYDINGNDWIAANADDRG